MTWVCIHGAAGPHLEVSHITPDRIRGTVWISWCVFAVCAGGGGGGGGARAGRRCLGRSSKQTTPRTHRKHKKASTAKKPKHQPPHQQQTQKHTHTHRDTYRQDRQQKKHTPLPTNSKEQHYPRRQQKKTNNTLPYEGVCCLGLNWPFTELLVCRGFSCRAQQQTKTTPFRLVCADRVTCRSPKPMLTARACVW